MKQSFQSLTKQIALAGLLLAIVLLSAFLTSNKVMPKIPIFNSRPDLWYGLAILSVVILPSMRIKMLFIFTLPFVLIFSELDSYLGFVHYLFELVLPLTFFVSFLILDLVKKAYLKTSLLALLTIVYFAIRLLFHAFGGHIYYQVPFLPSLIFNLLNVTLDLIVALLILSLTYWKLARIFN